MNGPVAWTAGDPLYLAGTIDGANLPNVGAWAGATAKITIWNKDTGVAVVGYNNVALTSFDATTRAYEHRGVALAEGNYEYVIKVTFTDASISPLTWPNDRRLDLNVVR